MDNIQEQIDYVDNLPQKIKNSLNWYTKSNHLDFNKKIREKLSLSPQEQEHFRNITTAFKNVPILKKPLVVYRGLKHFYKNHTTFISTSLDPEEALTFAGSDCCLMKFNIFPGSKILPIYKCSATECELEILLDYNVNITLYDKKKYKDVEVYFLDYYNDSYLEYISIFDINKNVY